MDVSENDKGCEVRAEVPGFKKEEAARKGERMLVKELYYTSASRSFRLEHDVDEKNAIAKFEDGVLKLSLPKKQEAASRVLSIQ